MSLAAMLRYLAIPLRGASLVLIALFSVLLLVAAAGGLLGLPLGFIILSWFFKYAFAILDQVADGIDEPPVLSYEMVNPANEPRPLALLIVIGFCYYVTGAIEPWVGTEVVAVLRIAGLLVLPAILMAQVVNGIVPSLNPSVFGPYIWRVPGSYALILAVAAALWWLARAFVVWLPDAELPMSIRIPLPDVVRIAILMYAWLAAFAMMGGVLFMRRDELGFEPAHSPERQQEKVQRERQREIDQLIDRIFAEWRGGADRNAWRTLQAHLQQSRRPTEDLYAVFERAANWPDQRLASRLAQDILPSLLAARRTGDALNMVRSRLQRDPNFRPLESADLIRLVELARDAGDRGTARTLLADFERRYPDATAQRIIGQLARQLER